MAPSASNRHKQPTEVARSPERVVTLEAVDHRQVPGSKTRMPLADAGTSHPAARAAEDVQRGHAMDRGARQRVDLVDPGGRAVHHDSVLGDDQLNARTRSFRSPRPAPPRRRPGGAAAAALDPRVAAGGLRRRRGRRQSAAVNGRSIGRGESSPRRTASRAHGGMTCMRPPCPPPTLMLLASSTGNPGTASKCPVSALQTGTKCPVTATDGQEVPGQKMISPALRRLRRRATASSRMSAASVSLRRSFT